MPPNTRASLSFTRTAYTPSGGNSFRASGASRFSVGTPIVRPRPAPRTTFPRIPYERPNHGPAASRSPCASAVRISVDEIGCPLSRTASTTATAKSCVRSEEHTSELQSRLHLVCRLLLEKKKKNEYVTYNSSHYNQQRRYSDCTRHD